MQVITGKFYQTFRNRYMLYYANCSRAEKYMWPRNVIKTLN